MAAARSMVIACLWLKREVSVDQKMKIDGPQLRKAFVIEVEVQEVRTRYARGRALRGSPSVSSAAREWQRAGLKLDAVWDSRMKPRIYVDTSVIGVARVPEAHIETVQLDAQAMDLADAYVAARVIGDSITSGGVVR